MSGNAMKKVAIIGATGYTGQELIRLLLQHDKVQIHAAVSRSYAGKQLSSVYPNFARTADLVCSSSDIDRVANEVDLIFLAMPHGKAAEVVTPDLLQKCAIIDLGGDFRLKDPAAYDEWYGFKHPKPALLKEAVYGLVEHNRSQIAGARLIANPGCYATCSILTVAPLLKAEAVQPDSIVIDAKSGVTGAGRGLSLGVHFDECNESLKAYKVAEHRHTPEIEQALASFSKQLSAISFTPHLVPMNRGILVTAYASLKRPMLTEKLASIYEEQYGDESFIRLFNRSTSKPNGSNSHSAATLSSAIEEYPFPETRFVKGSNFCDIGVTVDERTQRVVAIGAIDNLVKGAAGQAIQNMNVLFGWPESTGLNQPAIFAA
jgi:N-acetyl-gamma-glutamyl-phosphate reductase